MRFWVILLTDRQTDKRGQTRLPSPLSEVNNFVKLQSIFIIFGIQNCNSIAHLSCFVGVSTLPCVNLFILTSSTTFNVPYCFIINVFLHNDRNYNTGTCLSETSDGCRWARTASDWNMSKRLIRNEISLMVKYNITTLGKSFARM